MNIHILGAHNRESASSKMTSIVFDDVLAIDAGSLASSLSLENQQKLKAILLTHNHYDHIRDIPVIALNFFFQGESIIVYSTKNTGDAIMENLLNGRIYPDFTRLPETKPTVKFSNIDPYKQYEIAGYGVTAIPVNHAGVAVGYQIVSMEGKKAFFAADTGADLAGCWEHLSPNLLLIDVTFSNKRKEFAIQTKHLTPAMLERELSLFREQKGYLPQVVILHLEPALEDEIRAEIDGVSRNLNIPIALAHEGMNITL